MKILRYFVSVQFLTNGDVPRDGRGGTAKRCGTSGPPGIAVRPRQAEPPAGTNLTTRSPKVLPLAASIPYRKNGPEEGVSHERIPGLAAVCFPRLRRRPGLRRLCQGRPPADHARNEGQDGNHRPGTRGAHARGLHEKEPC